MDGPEYLLSAVSSAAPRSRRARYLVGASGGRDSMVLLHALGALGFRNLVVCHLDHGLRGAASRGDRLFVRRFAARHGLEWVAETLDLGRFAEERRISLETAGREARLSFFGRVAKAWRCPRVFLAHHGDDLAETFLFNLLRGAGPGGLAAMRPRTEIGKLALLRPMLAVSRAQIDEYARRHRVRYREDASNADPRHSRNRLRHEVIPLLEDVFGRDVRRSIRRTAEILRAEEDWIASLPELQPGADLSVKRVAALPLALQRRLLKAWMDRGGIRNAGFDDVERVRALLSTKTAKVNLPGARHARRRAGVLFLE